MGSGQSVQSSKSQSNSPTKTSPTKPHPSVETKQRDHRQNGTRDSHRQTNQQNNHRRENKDDHTSHHNTSPVKPTVPSPVSATQNNYNISSPSTNVKVKRNSIPTSLQTVEEVSLKKTEISSSQEKVSSTPVRTLF